MSLGFPVPSISHTLSCLVILGCRVMSLLFTDFTLFLTRLLEKHSIYPLLTVFYYYRYISSHFLKSLLSDVLSLLLGHIYLDYLLNFFYLIFLCSLVTSSTLCFHYFSYWKYRHYHYINTTITTIFSSNLLLL